MNRIIVLIGVLIIGAFIFTFFNASFYNTPIGKVTHVETSNAQKVVDEQHNTDFKYKDLTIKILNGKFKGESTTIDNTYVKSQADSEHFSKNNKVLMHIQNSPKDATILEKNAIA